MTGWAETLFVLAGTVAVVVGFRIGASLRRSPQGKALATRVSRMLMLGAVAVGSTSAGRIVAERAPHEPAPALAWQLFGVSGVALAAAWGLGFAARTPVQRVTRTRGRALVHSIREEGRGVHGIPVWTLDLDVTAPGVERFRTEVREEIPDRMVSSVRVGEHVPVQIERSRRGVEVTFDWIASPGAGEYDPRPTIAMDRPLAEQASESAVFRYSKVLLPMVIVAALSLLAARLLESA